MRPLHQKRWLQTRTIWTTLVALISMTFLPSMQSQPVSRTSIDLGGTEFFDYRSYSIDTLGETSFLLAWKNEEEFVKMAIKIARPSDDQWFGFGLSPTQSMIGTTALIIHTRYATTNAIRTRLPRPPQLPITTTTSISNETLHMSSSSTSSLYSTATNTTSNIPSPTPTETPMTSSLPLDETIALTPASIAEIRLFSKSSAGNYRIVSQGDSSRVYGPVVSSIAEDGDVVILFSVKRTTALQGISNENNISQVPFIFAAGEFSGSEGSSLKKHNIHGSGTFTLSSQFEQKPQPPTDNLQLIVPPNLSQFLPQGSLPQTFIAPEIPDAPPPALLKLTALPPLIPSRPTPVPESSSSTTDNPAPTPTAAPAVPPLLAFPFIVPLPFGVVPAPVPVPAPPVEEELGVEGKALAGLVVEAGFVESPKTTIPPLRIWR